MNILGINAYHGDSSAALVQDGKLVAAVEEERFTRIKHWAGFPALSIRYCLEEAGIGAEDLDHIALSSDSSANMDEKKQFLKEYALRMDGGIISSLKSKGSFILDRLKKRKKASSIMDDLATACDCKPGDIKAEFHKVEHHVAHMACAFFTSPFDEATILSIDGMGDFVSTLFGSGKGNQLEIGARVYFPHSLGYLYEAMTRYLGFHHYGDEYKVMGLAPYGEPKHVDLIREMISVQGSELKLNLDYFTHHVLGVSIEWEGGAPISDPFYSKLLEKELGPAVPAKSKMGKREEDIAASLQVVTEEIIFALMAEAHKKYPCDNICLTGGVAMNSVANGKIHKKSPFSNSFIPAGAADNGTSFGAAFYVWNQLLKKPRGFTLDHSFWGPEYGEEACQAAIGAHDLKVRKLDEDELCEVTADALVDGKIVGWYQGRMEFGARALGNRTLLADPRRIDARDIINSRIKFREKFRPFAPSILEEGVSEWFDDDVGSPFMEKVIPVREDKREKIPAVTHVDGTGRLHTVDQKSSPLYWKLIKAFEKRTGVPLVLNTSLNENEPIVCTPEEALNCFLRTKMDAIVLGPYYVERDDASE